MTVGGELLPLAMQHSPRDEKRQIGDNAMKRKYTPIRHHTRKGSTLKPPLVTMNFQPIDWQRDLLPEHLWIELLSAEYRDRDWQRIYDDFMNRLDAELPDSKTCLYGFITDFGVVPKQARESFLGKHKDFIYHAFFKVIGKVLTLYPDSPANWLLLEEWKRAEPVNFEVELNRLEKSVVRLLPGKDLHAGHIRALPLNRAFKHNKIYYNSDMTIVDLLPKYPGKCTEEEQYLVQQHARIEMNLMIKLEERFALNTWPKYFWRHNYDLVPCIPEEHSLDIGGKVSEEQMKETYHRIRSNCDAITDYLGKLGMQYKYDLYDSTKDEILLGLFSRLSRLYILFLSNSTLWAGDISGIFLRCMAETAIVFAYFAREGEEKEFLDFRKYGEGKQKLLMLHLQDTYHEQKAYDGQTVDDLADELGGGMNPELIEIELSDWTKKSSRELAMASGFEDVYRLIFDPASSDVHGTWTSLRKANLVYCRVALHGFHKMPSLVEPPLLLLPARMTQTILSRCLDVGIHNLNFPKLATGLLTLDSGERPTVQQ